jgi:hypothetical protein
MIISKVIEAYAPQQIWAWASFYVTLGRNGMIEREFEGEIDR